MKKKPTIKDIAKRANVSTATASMALRHIEKISESTRRKVLEAARELQYHPNPFARNLVSQESGTIGLIITTITNPFYPELAKGVEDKAREMDYNILLSSNDYSMENERLCVNMLLSKGVDGLLISSVETEDSNVAELIDEEIPFVLINRQVRMKKLENKYDYVGMDNFQGAYIMMEHLHEMGHHNICIIAGDPKISTTLERLEGAEAFLKDRGLKLDREMIFMCNYSRQKAYEETKKILSAKPETTAIFSHNDHMALGVREAVLEAGLRIPEDIAITGFQGICATSLTKVEITTIKQTQYEMGAIAAEILINKLKNKHPSATSQIILKPELIVRSSSNWKVVEKKDDRSEGEKLAG